MRRILLSLGLLAICLSTVGAQSAAPQTARQALLEMFFSKESGTFVKHLPAATLAAFEKSGALTGLRQYSMMAGQMQSQGSKFETFDTGSVLLSGEDPKTGQKFEVTVEKDSLRGDQDDLELSFVAYKDGQAQRAPYMPRVTFSMKKEARVWKLNEIAVTIRLPLADPDLLKAITEKMKPSAGANITFTAQPQVAESPAAPVVPAAPQVSDATVEAAVQTILTAETTYAATYPSVGYTCTLSDLDGFGSGEPNEHQAMLINSGLASGKRYGFVFTLSGCSGAPARGFRLSAAPNAGTVGRKAFCADQSGVIRTGADTGSCFAGSTSMQTLVR